MRHLLLLWLLWSGPGLYAQQIFVTNFFPVEEKLCAFDSTQTVFQPEGWLVYQTIDGHWDGPVDSTRCISVEVDPASLIVTIPLEQIDPAEALFIRSKDFPDALSLAPNSVFAGYACVYQTNDDSSNRYLEGADCPEGICSGMFVGIAIPDSNGVPLAETRYQSGFAKRDNDFCGGVSTCFPSEKFDDQRLRRIILKFTFPPFSNFENNQLFLNFIEIDGNFDARKVTHVDAQPWHLVDTVYQVPIQDVSTFELTDTYLMLYTEDTYPSPPHLSFIDAQPAPNTPEPKEINLIVEPYQTLEIQPFTSLRGGLVEGSDSIRHHANLVNMGGDFCMNAFLDVIFHGGDEYRHAAGFITMNHPKSCMQFRPGSALRVLDDAYLHYGNEGAGMLVLCVNSTLAIQRGATMEVDGMMSLAECNDNPGPQEIVIDLPPGAKLAFTEHALLTNGFSRFGNVTLGVRMLGGTLDDVALSAGERALIRRIYPEPSPVFAENISLLPNPFHDHPVLGYTAETEEELTLRWFNMNGQLSSEERFTAQKGYNEWSAEGPGTAGVYLLEIQGQNGRFISKTMKL